MTPTNVETIRRLFDHWERGDWQEGVELFDPEFEAVFSAGAFPDPGTYRGARNTLNAWRDWLDAWEEFSLELEDAIPIGDRVIALNRLRGRGKASGIAVDSEVGCIFDLRDGRIVRMVFCDRGEALEAVEAGRDARP